MKSFSTTAAILLFAASTGLGQTISEWTSQSATSWNTPASWSNGIPGVPGSTTSYSVLFGNTSTVLVGLDTNRTVSSIDFQRTSGAILTLDRASGAEGSILTVTNNFSTAVGSQQLIVKRIGLTVSGTLIINSSRFDLGENNNVTSGGASAVYEVSVANTAINSGTINVSRMISGNSITLGNLVMNQGALNLSAGGPGNGTDVAVENVLNVTRLSGTGIIQAGKSNSKAALVVNGSVDGTFGGTIQTGSSGAVVRLAKSGASKLELTNGNTYTGETTINGGTLLISGTGSINNSSKITVSAGTLASTSSTAMTGTVTLSGANAAFRHSSSSNYTGAFTFTAGTLAGTNWNGNLGGLTIASGQRLSPGNSPGTANTTSQTWSAGGNYDWQVRDASGVAGVDFDTINFSGTLDLTNLSSVNKFNINVWSLSEVSPDVNGDASNFGSMHSWLIATANSISIGDEDVNDLFNINLSAIPGFTGGFSNPYIGTWSVSLGGVTDNQLYLNYAIPEPGAFVLGGLGALFLISRRRNRASRA